MGLEEMLDAVIEAEDATERMVTEAKAQAKAHRAEVLAAEDAKDAEAAEQSKIRLVSATVAGDAEGERQAEEILAEARARAEALRASIDVDAEGTALAAAFEEWYGNR